jgi:small subunit ribosomal protein S11
MSNALQKKDLKKNKKKNIPVVGRVVVRTTFNNNIITLTDLDGNTIVCSSAGAKGFKGTRKATPYAAQMTAFDVGKTAFDLGVRAVSVLIRGIGSGRDSAVIALRSAGLKVSSIAFDIKIPHNGCRPRGRRRT